MQACLSANVSGVHAVINSIMIRNIQPVVGVRANNVTTPGYGGFNSETNPIFDPMVPMTSKMASLDLDPSRFLVPRAVCALSNPWFYPPSEFGCPAPLPHVDLTRPGYYGIPDAFE